MLRALGTEQRLVDEHHPPGAKRAPASPTGPSADAAESAWNQDFVTRYSEVLTPLAKEGLKRLQGMPAAPPPLATSPSKPGSGSPSVSAEELQAQREGLKRSMERAVELAPKVEKLSGEAAVLLRDRKPDEALPKQQEALKLLKEIAQPLPKQGQQQEPNEEKQKKQDQDKRDQKQEANRDQKQPDPKQQQQEASQQQTEAAIRQVQERQQKRQEMEKQLRRYQSSPGKVDKDW